MKPYIAAGLLLVGLATPAFAADQHYAVKDRPSLRQRARSPVYIGSPGQKLGAFWAVPF